MSFDPQNRLTQGFTLMEMLVVLVILGMIGALVMAHGPSHPARLELRNAAREIAASMREAHARALYSGKPQQFEIDPTAHLYRIIGSEAHSLPDIGLEPARPSLFIFLPDGSASGPVLHLTRGTFSLSLGVNWLTGAVESQGG
ncbi:prepilin-type N-terminal cleavage/methylation domain-containing protein [Asaia krungthepensis]|uniref:Tfp pilus assembly protein FimT n=1 Tax=Asaia krungthepensis NRIC 0535 TaxID=1307925 RepID=A0ABQ0Q235_9PROT|nr:prepilin-type N-terminal cleavage/methylation domain-containing protein [Asaia krungthepensis]GBQ87701.1 Tfp pilus assembly protein FimT [Asaia krungthepensis NRIC 0535]